MVELGFTPESCGEVEEPGRTSLRTLSTLKDMTQRDAEAFAALMEYRISDFIFEGWIDPPIAKELDSSFKFLLHTGLVYPNHPRVVSMRDLALGGQRQIYRRILRACNKGGRRSGNQHRSP